MRVFTTGMNQNKQFHAMALVCVLPERVFPSGPIKPIKVKLSNGKTVAVVPIIHSADSIGSIGNKIKRDVSNVVNLARAVFCRR